MDYDWTEDGFQEGQNQTVKEDQEKNFFRQNIFSSEFVQFFRQNLVLCKNLKKKCFSSDL